MNEKNRGAIMGTQAAVLFAALCFAAPGAGSAQTKQAPSASASGKAQVLALGEGNLGCREVVAIVAKERAARPKEAPKDAVYRPDYALLGAYADGVLSATNDAGGPLPGESIPGGVVGRNIAPDERMKPVHDRCLKHPDEMFYDAVRAVRREIVNRVER